MTDDKKKNKYNSLYSREHYITIRLTLRPDKDKDVIEQLRKEKTTDYVRRLVRKDISRAKRKTNKNSDISADTDKQGKKIEK